MSEFRPLVDGGPHVVAIGGGHGLARSLGAIRHFAGTVTAIVSVADDGGSSGRLREALSIPAPGDLRVCLSALLPFDSPLGEALEFRFSGGELDGHAFGNLLIAALAATSGGFVEGVEQVCRLLGTVGEVIPATSVPVVLKGEAGGSFLEGQVKIMATSGVHHVSLVPSDAIAPKSALAAIAAADAIVIGPGSLYTSVLAAIAPTEIADAISSSSARKIYVCNLREQIPETASYDVERHLDALMAHGVFPDVVIADESSLLTGRAPKTVRVLVCKVADATGNVHDEGLLATALARAITLPRAK